MYKLELQTIHRFSQSRRRPLPVVPVQHGLNILLVLADAKTKVSVADLESEIVCAHLSFDFIFQFDLCYLISQLGFEHFGVL